jgi:hypothetical protein
MTTEEWMASPEKLCCIVNPCGYMYGRKICRDCFICKVAGAPAKIAWDNFIPIDAVILSSQKAT